MLGVFGCRCDLVLGVVKCVGWCFCLCVVYVLVVGVFWFSIVKCVGWCCCVLGV